MEILVLLVIVQDIYYYYYSIKVELEYARSCVKSPARFPVRSCVRSCVRSPVRYCVKVVYDTKVYNNYIVEYRVVVVWW